jgi:tetratricopeptide (TPR) repeat protein
LFAGFTTIRSIAYVAMTLIVAFVITGAISSNYKRERVSLGQQHYEEGRSFEQEGQVEDAIDQYREALLFLPDNSNYRLSLANALLKAGHLDEAEAHFQQLSQQDPTNGRINLGLAQIAVKRHRIAEAIESYQRAVYEYWPPDAIPERRVARWELVGLLDATGRKTDEIAELLQLYSSAPPNPEERAKIGFQLLKTGAISEAAGIFRTLKANFPNGTYGHRGLGEVDFATGDYVSARHEFQRALRISPHDHEIEASLALTNAVIDMDPVLPDISSAERLRRSQRLLARITTELGDCLLLKAPTPVAQQQLDSARELLTRAHPLEEDYNLTLQRAAVTLWQNRSSFCPANETPNTAVDLTVRRISNE